jgi:hypothetical protein
MHARRALLLFAVVLGLAALVTAVSPSSRRRAQAPPPATPPQATARETRPDKPTLQLRFFDSRKQHERRLEQDRHAIVTVAGRTAGQAELVGLGMTAPLEHLSPARFDVLVTRPGRYQVMFTPAGEADPRRIGVLKVVKSPPS